MRPQQFFSDISIFVLLQKITIVCDIPLMSLTWVLEHVLNQTDSPALENFF